MIVEAPNDKIRPINCVLAVEAAKRIGVSRAWIRTLIKTGRLDVIRQGARCWVRIEDVDAYAAERAARTAR